MQTTRPLTNYAKKLCAVRQRNVTKPKHHPGSWGWTGMNGCLTKQLTVDDSKFSPRRTWMNELFHESMTFQLAHLIGPIDPWQGSPYVPSKIDLWSLLSWWFTIQVDPQEILWRIPRILKQQQPPSNYSLVLMKWYKKWNIVFATVMTPLAEYVPHQPGSKNWGRTSTLELLWLAHESLVVYFHFRAKSRIIGYSGSIWFNLS